MTGPTLLALLLLLATALLHRHLSRPVVPSPATSRPRPLPPLTIVRPIKGLDVGAEANLAALLAVDYPGPCEIMLALDDDQDPAYPMALAASSAAARRGQRVDLLLCGRPPPHRTGKLHAMCRAMDHASGELIAFNDSDSRPSPELFTKLVEALLADPRRGATFAPVVTVPEGATTVGDAAYMLLLNAWYGPAARVAAGESGRLPFIMGQAMVVSREALRRIGGLECAEGHFVDDMRIGQCIAAAGLHNVQIDTPLKIVVGGMSYRRFLQVFRRWLMFSKGGLPMTFVRLHLFKAVVWSLSAAELVGSLAIGAPLPGALCLLTLLLLATSDLSLQRRQGGTHPSWLGLGVALTLPIVGGAVLLSTKLWRRIDWRGRSYALDATARLGAVPLRG